MRKLSWLPFLLAIVSISSPSSAYLIPFSYNEDAQGDLSNEPSMPSALADNYLPVFAVQGTIVGTDYDIFTVDLAETGIQLDQIILEGYAGPGVSFIAVQSGSTWTAGLGGAIDPAQLLGWAHFGAGDLGSDLLATMSTGAGALGFIPPLEETSFTFLIQDISSNVNYTLRLETDHTPVADINDDGQLTFADADALVAEIVAQSNSPAYDYNCDQVVDILDLDEWLAIAGAENLPSQDPYLIADANLDGTVDGQDFIAWNEHKFMPFAAWSKGDFNADGIVDGQDFILWNQNKFMSADAVHQVPETAVSGVLIWLASLASAGIRRKARP